MTTKVTNILILMAALIMTACASKDEPTAGRVERQVPLYPAPIATLIGDNPSRTAPESFSRAATESTAPEAFSRSWVSRDGEPETATITLGGKTYVPYQDLYPRPINADYATIGVFLTPAPPSLGDANTMDLAGNFFYKEDNTWGTTVTVTPGQSYYMYGLMPYDDSKVTMTAAKRAAPDNAWDKGAVITAKDFPAVTSADVCVITGVLKAEPDELDKPINHVDIVPKLRQGVFKFTGSTSENFAYILMDHVYANVNFEFYVDKEYSKLRYFELTGVTMSSDVNENVDLSVELQGTSADEWDADDAIKGRDPILYIDYTPGEDTGKKASAELFPLGGDTPTRLRIEKEVESGTQLYTNVPGYFAPASTDQKFIFTFKYDVFDNDGHLIRKDCTAENHWRLQDNTATHGVSYRLKVKLKPTYLYVLGQYDMDNPTFEIDE